MLHRFADMREGNMLHRFFAVKQDGTVAEYRAQFEFPTAMVGKLKEGTRPAMFVNALQENIRVESMVINPSGLKEMMEVAIKIEAKNRILSPNNKTHKELPSNQTKPDRKTITWTPSKPSPGRTVLLKGDPSLKRPWFLRKQWYGQSK
ncbi:unnamed protein product [Dovyalis caffra]|uniref:Uncharacterized protein n=1 Tax=Dovyalis caffra TaxID=77055 RepID=A0AAV1QR87_9ROSI|nr:unnamed protein product [Dovyalis caffra]